MDNKKTKDFILKCLSSVWNFFSDPCLYYGACLSYFNCILISFVEFVFPQSISAQTNFNYILLTFLFIPLLCLVYFIRKKYTTVPIGKILKFTFLYFIVDYWNLYYPYKGLWLFILSIEIFILCKFYIKLNHRFPSLFNWKFPYGTFVSRLLKVTVLPFFKFFCDPWIYVGGGLGVIACGVSLFFGTNNAEVMTLLILPLFIALIYFIKEKYTEVPTIKILKFTLTYSFFYCTHSYLLIRYTVHIAMKLAFGMCLLCSLYIIVKNLINKKLCL